MNKIGSVAQPLTTAIQTGQALSLRTGSDMQAAYSACMCEQADLSQYGDQAVLVSS